MSTTILSVLTVIPFKLAIVRAADSYPHSSQSYPLGGTGIRVGVVTPLGRLIVGLIKELCLESNC